MRDRVHRRDRLDFQAVTVTANVDSGAQCYGRPESIAVLEISAAVTAVGAFNPLAINRSASAASVVPTPPETIEPTTEIKLSANKPTEVQKSTATLM